MQLEENETSPVQQCIIVLAGMPDVWTGVVISGDVKREPFTCHAWVLGSLSWLVFIIPWILSLSLLWDSALTAGAASETQNLVRCLGLDGRQWWPRLRTDPGRSSGTRERALRSDWGPWHSAQAPFLESTLIHVNIPGIQFQLMLTFGVYLLQSEAVSNSASLLHDS